MFWCTNSLVHVMVSTGSGHQYIINVLIVVSTEAPSCHQSSLAPQTLPTSITHTLTNTHMLLYWHLCWGRSGVYTSGVCQSNRTYCSVSPRLHSLHQCRALLRIQTCNSSSSDIQLRRILYQVTISGLWCIQNINHGQYVMVDVISLYFLQYQHPFCAAYLWSESKEGKDAYDRFVGWKQH